MAEYEGDDQLSGEGSLGPKTSLESEGSLGAEPPLPTATGSGRKSSGRGSGKLESGRGSGEIESGRGSGEIGSRRGSREIGSGRGSGTLETGRGSGSLESGQGSGEIKVRVGSGKMVSGRGIEIRVGSGKMETRRSLRNVSPRQGSQVRGPFAPGPPTRGPSQRGPLTRGPPTRGPSTRGPLTRGPSQRGPLTPGPPTRGPSTRGPLTPGLPTRGPSQRGPLTPGPPTRAPSKRGPPTPGPPKKKSFMDTLRGSALNIFKKSKTSKLEIPGKPKQKPSLLAKITKSATSFMSMLNFTKKKPPPKPQPPRKPQLSPLRARPPIPPPRPPPRMPSRSLSRPRSSSPSRRQSKSRLQGLTRSRTPSETPPGSLDRPPSELMESERVLKVTELGRFPSHASGELENLPSERIPMESGNEDELEESPPKRLSQTLLTKSVMEKIADEVTKLATAQRSCDSITGRRRGGMFCKQAVCEASKLCDQCHQRPPCTAAILAPPVAFQPMEFAGPLYTAPYLRRGVLDLVRQFEYPMSAFTAAVAAYPVPVAPPPLLPSSPSQALFPQQHFPVSPFLTSPFSQFSPYTSGAMPHGFHPGMGPLPSPYSFASPYRNSATRAWPQSSWLNSPFGMAFAPNPIPVHSFPKSPCEINPALCQPNLLICPCGCGRPVANQSFYR